VRLPLGMAASWNPRWTRLDVKGVRRPGPPATDAPLLYPTTGTPPRPTANSKQPTTAAASAGLLASWQVPSSPIQVVQLVHC